MQLLNLSSPALAMISVNPHLHHGSPFTVATRKRWAAPKERSFSAINWLWLKSMEPKITISMFNGKSINYRFDNFEPYPDRNDFDVQKDPSLTLTVAISLGILRISCHGCRHGNAGDLNDFESECGLCASYVDVATFCSLIIWEDVAVLSCGSGHGCGNTKMSQKNGAK